ncbi:peptidylprolyl isomerase [Candidatus Chlorohelix sp.]|uniref:peptidylprolyl isomerase n=1 Tax=Candidatus Chlorohelix sp. TaxID=3139201 RepID=UPI00303712FE
MNKNQLRVIRWFSCLWLVTILLQGCGEILNATPTLPEGIPTNAKLGTPLPVTRTPTATPIPLPTNTPVIITNTPQPVGITNTPLPSNQVLAELNGQTITFDEYLRYRRFYAFRDLFFYQTFVVNPKPTAVDIEQLRLLQKQLDDLPYQPVDKRKLQQYLQGIILVTEAKKDYGITVSADEIDLEIGNQIGPAQTFSQADLEATATAGTVYTAVASIELATIAAVTLPPGVTALPTPTVPPTPTPIMSPAATAVTRQQTFFEALKQVTGLTRDDYRRYEAEPSVVSRKLDQKLRAQLPKIGDNVPQWHFSQIVFNDEATAQATMKDLQAIPVANLPEAFAKAAQEKSQDMLTAYRKGDAGWVVEQMVETDLFNLLKGLKVGQFAAPIQNGGSWVLVTLTGYEPNRPLDASQWEYLAGLSYGRSVAFDNWMHAKIQAANVKFFL